MDLAFRPPCIADLKEIFQINQDVQPVPWTQPQIEEEILVQSPLSLVALADGKIVGYCFVRSQADVYEIFSIGVSLSHQRKGVGASLFKRVLRAMGTNAVCFLEVAESNLKAISFYTRWGFQKVGVRKGYYSNGEDALVLKLSVAFP